MAFLAVEHLPSSGFDHMLAATPEHNSHTSLMQMAQAFTLKMPHGNIVMLVMQYSCRFTYFNHALALLHYLYVYSLD